MLSNEAEHFLLQLRLELMSRGKKDEDIESIEEELRDHLIEAESRGDSIESVTGGSVDEYIKSISNELPFDKNLISFMFMILIGSLLLTIIPDLVRGDYELSLYRLFYYLTITFVGLPLTIFIMKSILKKYGDHKKSYILFGIYFMITTAIFVGTEFILKNIDSPIVLKLDNSTSFYIGLSLTIIYIIVCIIFKQFYLIAVVLYLVFPDLVAKLLTSKSPNSEEFITISTITFTILNFVIIIAVILFFKKTFDKEKKNADH